MIIAAFFMALVAMILIPAMIMFWIFMVIDWALTRVLMK